MKCTMLRFNYYFLFYFFHVRTRNIWNNIMACRELFCGVCGGDTNGLIFNMVVVRTNTGRTCILYIM